jgi:hypothetical protein
MTEVAMRRSGPIEIEAPVPNPHDGAMIDHLRHIQSVVKLAGITTVMIETENVPCTTELHLIIWHQIEIDAMSQLEWLLRVREEDETTRHCPAEGSLEICLCHMLPLDHQRIKLKIPITEGSIPPATRFPPGQEV